MTDRRRRFVPEDCPPPGEDEMCGWGRLKYILLRIPTANVEVAGAFAFFCVGLWFVWPTHEFPTGGVLSIASGRWSWMWGPGFLLLGLYKTWVLLYAYHTRHRFVVTFIALLMIWQVFLAYRRVSPDHVGVMVCIVALLQQTWIVARNGRTWKR